MTYATTAGNEHHRVSRATLEIVPCSIQDARAIVARWHRHHKPPCSGLFAVACINAERSVVGVAIVGRPVSRALDNGYTCEVTRVATDGTRNACSALYGAAWRAAKALGWRRMVTYTLPEEGGASLRGAGWRMVGEAGGGLGWLSRPCRSRSNTQTKTRWEVGEHVDAESPTRAFARASAAHTDQLRLCL